MGAPAVPPKIKRKDATTLEPVGGAYTGLDFGVVSASESTEITIREIKFTNDVGEEFVGFRETLTMTDETDGTEDVTRKIYLMTNGTLTEV